MIDFTKLIDAVIDYNASDERPRAALQAAIESLKTGNEQLNREIQSQYRCIKSHAQVTQKAEAERDTMREALKLAMENLRPHGDNCFLHDEGEYNACFCGKDSLVDHLQSVAENAEFTGADAASEPKGLFVDLIASLGPEFVAEMAAIEPVGINGLTEAETSASMSVMGLSKPQAQGEAGECPVCEGHGMRTYTKGWGPDQYDYRAPCDECDGSGSIEEAYAKVAKERDVLQAKLTHPQAIEPAGWKRVPVEPTPEMREAGLNQLDTLNADPNRLLADRAYFIYRAMLAAAPKQPTNTVQE